MQAKAFEKTKIKAQADANLKEAKLDAKRLEVAQDVIEGMEKTGAKKGTVSTVMYDENGKGNSFFK